MQEITVLRGDGIGPEITSAVLSILKELNLPLIFKEYEVGEACLEKYGSLIPDEVFNAIERTKVFLKAPITTPIGKGFRSLNVTLRLKYDMYANIRPAKSLIGINTPFKDVDIVTFRENTEDLYIGEEIIIKENEEVQAIKKITRKASERIIRQAFEYAIKNKRHKVTCVHKANILKESDGLFLKVFREIKEEYPSIATSEIIVDALTMKLVMNPSEFDILVMPNLYGDIVSDLTSGLIGGLGVLPSANIGDEYMMFEAVHGSAPDLAGLNKANPLALLLASLMMLDYLGFNSEANRVRKAIDDVLENGNLTCDLGGTASTSEFADEIIAAL